MKPLSICVARKRLRQLIRLTLFSSMIIFSSTNSFASDTEESGFESAYDDALDIEEQATPFDEQPRDKLVRLFVRALRMRAMKGNDRAAQIDSFKIWLKNDFWTEEKVDKAIAVLEYFIAPTTAKPTKYRDEIERLMRDVDVYIGRPKEKQTALSVAGIAGIGEGIVCGGSLMTMVIGGTIGTAVSCGGRPGCLDDQVHVDRQCFFHNGTLAGDEHIIKSDTDCSIGASISFGIPVLIFVIATVVVVPVIIVSLCIAWKKHVDWRGSSVRLRDESGIELLPEIIMVSPAYK